MGVVARIDTSPRGKSMPRTSQDARLQGKLVLNFQTKWIPNLVQDAAGGVMGRS